jgi:hypothetical protein
MPDEGSQRINGVTKIRDCMCGVFVLIEGRHPVLHRGLHLVDRVFDMTRIFY